MVLVILQLAGNTDTFIRDSLTLDVKHLRNENVSRLVYKRRGLLTVEPVARCAFLVKKIWSACGTA